MHCHRLHLPDEKTEAHRDLPRVTPSVRGSETDSKSPATLPPAGYDNGPKVAKSAGSLQLLRLYLLIYKTGEREARSPA